MRGHEMVDWIADYWERVESLDVLSSDAPGAGLERLPETPPAKGEGDGAWDSIFEDLGRVSEPGLTHWQHPSFFGYFPCNASGPAVLGELLSAGRGIQGMLWQTSPIATELETRMLDWMRIALGLPERFASIGNGGGVIQGTASEATLVALLAARQRARAAGTADEKMVVYTSDQAHSSVIKAAMIAGVAQGTEDRTRVRLVATNARLELDMGALAEAMQRDVEAGLVPTFVSLTAGTTSTGAFDSIAAACDACAALEGHVPWVHVDGAWGGVAAICEEHRGWLDGIERADSVCVNPHKWLLTNFDCDLFCVADRAALVEAMSITPEYLRNAASDAGAVIAYRDWQVPLGRRFRALKLWFVLRHYGVEGLSACIREHCAWAAWLEERVLADDRFELGAKRSLSLVCLRLKAGEAATKRLMERVNATGQAFLTHTVVPTTAADGSTEARYVIRVAIGSTSTRLSHVEALWALLESHADAAGSGAMSGECDPGGVGSPS